MKRIFSVMAGLVALSLIAATMLPPLRQVDNEAFEGGEFLKYNVHYGLITAGYATVEVKPTLENVKGRNCYHIVGKGYTNSSYDWIFKVRDRYETYLDAEALVPWRFVRNIDEGDFKNYTETHFDHNTGKAYFVDENSKVTTFSVPANIQDVISAFYYARTWDRASLKVGDKIPLTNFLDRKVFKLEAKLMKKENIVVSGKTYKALKMKLLVEEAGIITDGSKIDFWISDDDNKIPLRIESQLAIGSVKADLIETKNLKNPLTSLVK